MKNHSCLPGCSNGLKSICGTSIDLDDIDFGTSQNHLLYVDKVYSKGKGNACPVMFNVSSTPCSFQTQLFMAPMNQSTENLCEEIFGTCCSGNHGKGCGCNSHQKNDCGCNSNQNNNCDCCTTCCGTAGNCTLDSNATFKIVKSYVRVRSFEPTANCCLNTNQVTIDGCPVDALSCQGNSYEAIVRQNANRIVKDTCSERGLPTKAFFLISCAGPWSYQADFVLEGTVNTGGSTCCFRAIFSTRSKVAIPNATSNLSVPKISIPCVTEGIAPRLFFEFTGKINLLNPMLCLVENGDCDAPSLILTAAAVAEPVVNVEVVKKSLFCINCCEALIPCDGSANFVGSEEDEDDDEDSLYGPDCHCGSGGNHNSCGNNNSCGNQGNASDCNRRENNACESFENSGCGNTLAYGSNTSCSSCCRGY